MGFEIDDGTSSGGFSAKVDSKNRLFVKAVQITEDQHINESNNKAWSIPFEGLNPAAADDYVIYIKNTGDKTVHISDIRVMADTAATQLEIHAVSGTAIAGSPISLVPKTVGAAALPSAIIESGTDITGLTSDGIVYFIQCPTVGKEEHLRTSSKIRIPKGKAIALLVETGTANLTGIISLVEEE